MTTKKCIKSICMNYKWKKEDTGRAYDLTPVNGCCMLNRRMVHRMKAYPEGCPLNPVEPLLSGHDPRAV